MYIAIVALLTVVLPLGSALVEHAVPGAAPFLALIGKWFVFWAAGMRLVLAGVRQLFQPEFTARQIFRIEGADAFPLVREIGAGNLALGAVGAHRSAAGFHSASRDRRRDLLRHSRLPASPGEGPQPQRNRRHGHRPLRLRLLAAYAVYALLW